MYCGKENAAVTAMCPYFKSEFRKSITCDGIGCAESITTKFNKEEDKDIHIKIFCKKYPNTCEIAKILDDQEE